MALDDYTYRTLIKLQIAANRWDGSADQAYEAWRSTFESSNIIIEDHLDMSITIGIAGRFQSTSQQALFTKQISPFKPGGVRISVYFIATRRERSDLRVGPEDGQHRRLGPGLLG